MKKYRLIQILSQIGKTLVLPVRILFYYLSGRSLLDSSFAVFCSSFRTNLHFDSTDPFFSMEVASSIEAFLEIADSVDNGKEVFCFLNGKPVCISLVNGLSSVLDFNWPDKMKTYSKGVFFSINFITESPSNFKIAIDKAIVSLAPKNERNISEP